jgi:arginyl-tRNA synthetase
LYVKEINSIVGKLTIICDNNFIIRLLFENDNFNEVIKKLDKKLLLLKNEGLFLDNFNKA